MKIKKLVDIEILDIEDDTKDKEGLLKHIVGELNRIGYVKKEVFR
jgi:hypothetical protein